MKQNEDVFEFETEALALKNNTDYNKLVQCLCQLTGARQQALSNLDQLLKVQEEALADPFEFVRKLKAGEDLGIPDRVFVPEVPQIDWEKYKMHPFVDYRPTTRPKQRDVKADVRRCKEESKSPSHNQMWTPEEQLRLEQLLIEYPPEDNEAQRFKKIAKALGNRTLSQVTSRCQKYFTKLHRAGLPVPGRIPRRVREASSKVQKKMIKTIFPKPPRLNTPYYSELPGTSSVTSSFIKIEVDSEDSNAGEQVQQTTSDRKLALLRRVQSDLMRQTDNTFTHPGFMCNICQDDPLKGTRWHCAICEDMDVCSWCLIEQLEADTHQHPLDHALVAYRPIPTRSLTADKDYPQLGDNYLDMNYQPM